MAYAIFDTPAIHGIPGIKEPAQVGRDVQDELTVTPAHRTRCRDAPHPSPPNRPRVELQVGRTNGCGFRVDIHIKEAAAAAWRHSTVFTAALRQSRRKSCVAQVRALSAVVAAHRSPDSSPVGVRGCRG